MVSIQPQQSLTPHFAIEPLPHPSNCNLLIAAASCYIPQQVLGQMLALDWLQHETAIAIQFEFNRLWNDQPLASEPLLCRGDRSPAVLALKTLLNHQNGLLVPQEGTIDDEFSALTHVTVIRFQLQHGLLDDGIVGPVTPTRCAMRASQRLRSIAVGALQELSESRRYTKQLNFPTDSLFSP